MFFSGITAWRNYTWGYECVHCGKKVETAHSVVANAGQMCKGTQRIMVNNSVALQMVQQAERELAVNVEAFTRQVNLGNFTPPENASGCCPFCKKYQHWAAVVNTQSKESTLKTTLKNIGKSLLISLVANTVLLGVVLTNVSNPNISHLIMVSCAFVALFAVLMIPFTRHSNAINRERAALKGLTKSAPYFISWGDSGHNSSNMTIY